MSVALVTDSTACLPTTLVAAAGAPVVVVPLGVGLDDDRFVEGVDIDAETVAAAQRQGRRVTTSRPSPAALLEAYEAAHGMGVDAVVAVHCSGALSSTVASARSAAAEASLPVTVLDSGTLGMAMGFAVLEGASRAAGGASSDEVAAVVAAVAASSVTTFYVDSLEPLRRGGRIGRAGALVGSALSIKPLLTVVDGEIAPADRARTTARAMKRLVERTVEAAAHVGVGDALVAVHALTRTDLASQVTGDLATALDRSAEDVVQARLGAVVAAHVGAGTVATVVASSSQA